MFCCKECDLEFWQPLKICELFYERYLPKSEVLEFGRKELPRYCKPFLRRLKQPVGRLLDVGCGDGAFLEAMKGYASAVVGVDANEQCIHRAKKNRGLVDMHAMTLNAFTAKTEQEKARFDVVSFFEVLEHQDSPKNFMACIKRLLKPDGGMIIGSVPNRGRLFADGEAPIRVPSCSDAENGQRSGVIGDLPPPHLTRWSRASLEWFLRNEGFEDIVLEPVGLDGRKVYSVWLETIFLGSIRERIKELARQHNSGTIGTTSPLSVSSPEEKGYRPGRLLNSLKGVIFMPLALMTFREFNRRGLHTYFQARWPGGPRD